MQQIHANQNIGRFQPGLRTALALALAFAILFSGSEALACATCGCSLSNDAAMGYMTSSGFSVFLDYSYINQDQLRGGSGKVSPAQVVNNPTTGELEHQTINRYITAGLSYRPSADWNYQLLVPYIDRSHTSYTDTTSAPFDSSQLAASNISGSRSSSLGDIKFIMNWQGMLPTHNLGFQLGVKLPTGDYGGPNAAGTGTVGRNPVYFGTGPSAGQLLDTSLQPGTGSTDLIVGGYYYQAVSQNFDAFVNGQFQAAVKENLDQAGEDYRPGNLTTVSFGARYEANPKIVPQLQVNITHKSADQGALADTLDTAGNVVYLSPGISASVMKGTQTYAFVQLPVYSKLDGYQIFPRWTASVGIRHSF
jgi:hypothetical protein